MMDQTKSCTVLIVEDEAELRQMLLDILHEVGFSHLIGAGSCQEARKAAAEPQAVILDVNLPDGDGFSLFQELWQAGNVPTIFLSARDADADRLHGLGLGADDYITKPFLPDELVLRLTALLKRSYRLEGLPDLLRLGEITVNWASGMVHRPDGAELPLTAKETALLRKLAEERGRIVTVDALGPHRHGGCPLPGGVE